MPTLSSQPWRHVCPTAPPPWALCPPDTPRSRPAFSPGEPSPTTALARCTHPKRLQVRLEPAFQQLAATAFWGSGLPSFPHPTGSQSRNTFISFKNCKGLCLSFPCSLPNCQSTTTPWASLPWWLLLPSHHSQGATVNTESGQVLLSSTLYGSHLPQAQSPSPPCSPQGPAPPACPPPCLLLPLSPSLPLLQPHGLLLAAPPSPRLVLPQGLCTSSARLFIRVVSFSLPMKHHLLREVHWGSESLHHTQSCVCFPGGPTVTWKCQPLHQFTFSRSVLSNTGTNGHIRPILLNSVKFKSSPSSEARGHGTECVCGTGCGTHGLVRARQATTGSTSVSLQKVLWMTLVDTCVASYTVTVGSQGLVHIRHSICAL
jgi:hypothetical protein